MTKYSHIIYLVIILLLSWKILDLHQTNSDLVKLINEKQNDNELVLTNKAQSIFTNTSLQSTYEVLDISSYEVINLPSSGSKLNLFIFFTLNDCVSCFEEIPFWNELYLKYGEVIETYAIAYGDSPEKIEYFARSHGIDLPVYFDKESTFFNDLSIVKGGHTPLKVLVDSLGKVIYTQQTTRTNREFQNAFISFIEERIVSL